MRTSGNRTVGARTFPHKGLGVALGLSATGLFAAALAFGQSEPTEPTEPAEPLPPAEEPAYPELPTPAEVDASSSLPPPAQTSPAPAPTVPVPAPPPEEAEEESEVQPPATLFSSDQKLVLGGFGGLNVRYTRVLGNDSVWVGGEGALLLNHALSVGGGGGGIANQINPTQQTRLDFGYGGLILRYHFFSSQVVNFAVGGLIGAGAIAVYDRGADHQDIEWDKVGETVFVFEPELGLYLNVTRWMRVGITGGYRFVSGVDKNDLSETDVRGAAGGGSLQFGWF